jgi:hypothetical protein
MACKVLRINTISYLYHDVFLSHPVFKARVSFYSSRLMVTVVTNNFNCRQDSQCTCNVILRRVRESLLQWKSNKYYIFVCVCVCACVLAFLLACMRVYGYPGMWASACVRACSLVYPACNSYASYCDIICRP